MNVEAIKRGARDRVWREKQHYPMEDKVSLVHRMEEGSGFPFERVLREGDLSLIWEIADAEVSPRRGEEIAKRCESLGISAVALQADTDLLLVPDDGWRAAADAVNCPILRRDTVVDAYQIYEAKLLGASAISLIAALHTCDELFVHIETAHRIGLSAVVEVQNEDEIAMALEAGARVIGVSCLDEEQPERGIALSIRLREYVPDHVIFVADGGDATPEALDLLRENGADAVFVKEAFLQGQEMAGLRCAG